MAAIDTVHVVFKTHLDLGFTDLASEVRRAYVEDFIPAAIRLARDLAEWTGPERFVWTTGSWLITDYLEQADAEAAADLDRAIREGHIAWHALPFTTHSEMMDSGLFRHGLSIAARLDARYGRRTIAAKMTDVPGHTIGIVAPLHDAGVRYLHIGTNPASATPQVPETFVWRAPSGEEVVVSYAAAYGSQTADALEVVGFGQALYVSLTNDNHGPPSADRIAAVFADLAHRYPGAKIRAGRLDDFAAGLWEHRRHLPVLTDEIGDTWIHGIAADPTQVSRFRALQRLRAELVATGRLTPGTPEHDRFADRLLLIPEHTWGMDQKRFLPDYVSWDKDAFAAARRRDVIDPADNPAEFSRFVGQAADPVPPGGFTFSAYEASWAEQRRYLDDAVEALEPVNAALARSRLADLVPRVTDRGGTPLGTGTAHRWGMFEVVLGPDGSIVSLVDHLGRTLADHDHRLAAYSHVGYDVDDYARWLADYHEDLAANESWVVPDFGKPGLASTGVRHAVSCPEVVSVRHRHHPEHDEVTVVLRGPDVAAATHGAPRRIELRYVFSRATPTIDVTLSWFDADASRLPEASWLAFVPVVEAGGRWGLDKLGTEIDPTAVVVGGNRHAHAVGTGAWFRGADRSVELGMQDAAVIFLGGPQLLRFDAALPDPADGWHVNLHNNVWGTNFRQWCADDATFRFRLTLG